MKLIVPSPEAYPSQKFRGHSSNVQLFEVSYLMRKNALSLSVESGKIDPGSGSVPKYGRLFHVPMSLLTISWKSVHNVLSCIAEC